MGVEIGMIRVSVAVATYNGERYLAEQLESILDALEQNDEIVISDDGSTDDTRKVIETFQKKDSRIRLVDGPRQGVKKNFESAIRSCSGQYIFLCDQDDIWTKDKVEVVLHAFEKEKCSVRVSFFDYDCIGSVFNKRNSCCCSCRCGNIGFF